MISLLSYFKTNPAKTKHFLSAAVLIALIALFYGNTLANGFIHDDHGQIEQNIYIQSWQYLPKVLTGCIWEAALGGCKERTSYYRPLQSLSYLITYSISPKPWFFHLVNLVYFAAVAIAVYALVFALSQNWILSLLSAGLFVVHPLNSETVNWLATVPELLYTLFVLLGALYYLKYHQQNRQRRIFYVIGFYALALLSKEPGFLLPAILIVFDLLYRRISIIELFRWKNLWPYLALAGVFGVYLILRLAVLGNVASGEFYSLGLKDRFIAFFELKAQYLGKLFWPQPLLLFYYPFTISKSLLAQKFLISLAAIVGFGAILFWSLKKRQRFISFSLIWLAIFLLPALLFLNNLGENVFSERYGFASSIGFAMALAYGLIWLAQRSILAKRAVIVIVIVMVIVSFKIVWTRNKLWTNDTVLYAVTLAQNPKADLIRYNLAVAQRDQGQPDKALENFKIIENRASWRDLYKVYNNLGDLYRQQGDYGLAQNYFQKALSANAQNERAYNNLGALNLEQGRPLPALLYFCKALTINPQLKEANLNFSRLSGTIGSLGELGYLQLYQDITQSGTFQPATASAITFNNKWCSPTVDGQCHYLFQPRLAKQETLLPFLITARDRTGSELVRLNRSEFDSKAQRIILDADARHGSTPLEFLFPTCDGVYYKVTAK